MDWYRLEGQMGDGKREAEFTHAALVPGGVIVKHETYRSGGASPALSESMVFIPGDLAISRGRDGNGYEIVPAIRGSATGKVFDKDSRIVQAELIGKLVDAAAIASSPTGLDRVDLVIRIQEILDAEKQQS